MKKKLSRLFWLALLLTLLYFALRNAPLTEIFNALKNLKFWQVGIILAINIFVLLCMTARWWIIVRAENPSVPFLRMLSYRLTAFGISYFTPGPQVGGEPFQVLALQKNHGLTLARASSAVVLDKLLEFIANFILIGAGAWSIVSQGLLLETGARLGLGLSGLAVLLASPLVYILLLYAGIRPVSKLLASQSNKNNKTIRLVRATEWMASSFCRKHFRAMRLALGVSLAAIFGIALEYFLMTRFLEIKISVPQTLAALTAMQISFLMPLPGGLGALEASQVFALGVFGQSPATAIGLTLLMRARDLLNGVAGLLLAGRHIAQ